MIDKKKGAGIGSDSCTFLIKTLKAFYGFCLENSGPVICFQRPRGDHP
jgi:hypothetical protein